MAFTAALAAAGGTLGLLMMFPSLANRLRQFDYGNFPNELVQVQDAVNLRYRGLITEAEYRDELRKQGFDEVRADKLYRGAEQLLRLGELVTLYRRGELTLAEGEGEWVADADYTTDSLLGQAHAQGFTPYQVQQYLKASEVVPSVGDIINFAVREVYLPEVAEAFGQYEGADQVINQASSDIAAAGFTPETFRKYWAAHWQLPGVTQGFEMLHRGVIPEKATESESLSLERLLVALDIMPAWREKLTEISYSPYTRVDVRRMNKLGVLDDFGVFKAYADLGFNPYSSGHTHADITEAFDCDTCRESSVAGTMLGFTLAYNYEPPEIEQSPSDHRLANNRDLTRSDIERGFRDGLLTRGEAITSLGEIGYGGDEIEFYLERVEFEREKDETDTIVHNLHDGFIRGVLERNEVADNLAGLNLSGERIARLFNQWDLEKRAKTNKPTKAEILTFLRKNVISEETAREELSSLGYADKYIGWYMATV